MTFNVRLRAYSPGTDTKLGFLADPISFQASFVHNNDGALTVKYSELGEDGNLAARTVDQGLDVALEYSTGGAWAEPDNGRFLMVGKDYDRHDPAKVHNLSLVSWSWLMTKICDLNLTKLEGSKSKNAGKRKFASKDAGDIVKTLLDEHDARSGPAVPIVRDSWSASVDSAGVAWSKKRTRYYEPGQPLHDRLDALVQDGLCDWRTRGRGLRMYNQNSACIDRSATVRLAYGDDLNDAPSTVSQSDRVARLLVKGDGKHRVTVTDPAVPELYGRWEAMMDASGVDSNAELDEAGDSELATRNRVKGEYTRDLTLSGTFLPFVDYNVGDWITAPGAAGSERLRVMQITITRDEQNGLSGNVVLGDRFTSADLKMAGKLAAITGGSTAAGGSGTSASVPVDTRQPAAPTNLAVTSDLYFSAGRWLVRCDLSWDAVTLATDGTELEIDHYTILGQRGAEPWKTLASTPNLSMTVDGLTPGDGWLFAVQAVGATTTGTGVLSPTVSVTLPVDQVPPQVPSVPALSSAAGVLHVRWDGLDSTGAAMPDDFVRVEVLTGTSNPPAVLSGSLARAGEAVVASAVGETVWVALRAVDVAGNVSALSAVASTVIKSVLDDTGLAAALAGKSQVIASDNDPALVGGNTIKDGDWWFLTSDGKITAIQRRVSGAWVVDQIHGSEVLAALSVVARNLAADAVTADKIQAGAIYSKLTATHELKADVIETGILNAALTLSGVIATAATGSRVVLDQNGITVYDASGTPAVEMTAATTRFTGKVVTDQLTVSETGLYKLAGAGEIASGSTLTLASQITAPTSAPSVSSFYNSITLKGPSGEALTPRAVCPDGSGGFFSSNVEHRIDSDGYGMDIPLVYRHDSTGAWVATWRAATATDVDALLWTQPSLTFLDGVLYFPSVAQRASYVWGVSIISLTAAGAAHITSTWVQLSPASSPSVAISNDGTNLVLAWKANNIQERFTTCTTAAVAVETVSAPTGTETTSPPVGCAVGTFDFGAKHFIFATSGETFKVLSAAGSWASGYEFAQASATTVGVWWYSGVFYSADATGRVYTHDGHKWTDSGATKTYNWAYSWYDAIGTVRETTVGPAAAVTIKKRARVAATIPAWTPGGDEYPNQARIYAAVSGGSYYLQGAASGTTITLSSIAQTGTTPPAASTFLAATPAQISNPDGTLVISADGTVNINGPLLIAGAPIYGRMTKTSTGPAYSANTWTQVTGFTSEDVENGVTVDRSAGRFAITTPGWYRVKLHARWQNYGSVYRRQVAIVRGTAAPAADNSNVIAGSVFETTGWLAHDLEERRVYLDAGVITLWVYSAVGSTFNNTSSGPVPPPTYFEIEKVL